MMRVCYLLLISTALLSLVTTSVHCAISSSTPASDSSLLSTLSYYEIVELHAPTHDFAPPAGRGLHTESTDGNNNAARSTTKVKQHPHSHQFSFSSHSQTFHVSLTKNVDLFSPGYSESRQHWTNDGVRHREKEPPVKQLTEIEHCYYQGEVRNHLGVQGTAGVHTCEHGFSGMVIVNPSEEFHAAHDEEQQHAGTYIIEPAHKHLDAETLANHVEVVQQKKMAAAQESSSASSSSSSTPSAVKPHSLHIVYKLEHSASYRELADSGFSGCGVGNADVESDRALHAHDHDHLHEMSEVHKRNKAYQQQFQSFETQFGGADGKQHQKASSSMSPFLSKLSLSPSSFDSYASSYANAGRSRLATSDTSTQRYVELFIANDQARYETLGQASEARSAAIVNFVNAHYKSANFTPPLQIVLIGQATFFYQDPWNLTLGGCSSAAANEMCVDKLLGTWNEWRRNPDNTQPYQANDAGHLFSGLKFQSVVLGYAGVGSMCSTSQSGGIEQLTNSADSFNAVIAAHEIGHNLGMQHDSNKNPCPQSGFIMNAVVNPGLPPSSFSNCSTSYFQTWFQGGSGSCLDNEPKLRYGAAICGNGYVEANEQCDCGPYGSGLDNTNVAPDFCQTSSLNPCCDALSCQFITDAVCSNTDKCCTDCQFSKASENKLCRAKANSCDLQELCDGTSATCPFDDTVGNGQSCLVGVRGVNYTGACFEGKCVNYLQQCSDIGNIFPGGPWIPCPVQEALNEQKDRDYCGELYCTTSTATSATTCTYFDFSSAPEQMADGNPCGPIGPDGLKSNTMLCYKGSCQPAEDTNPRFQWHTTDWAKCSDCNTYQSRNVTCVRTATGQTSADKLCTASARPTTIQPCSDEELLCDHAIEGTLQLTVFGRPLTISSATVIGSGVGGVFFIVIVVMLCTSCIIKRDTDVHYRVHASTKRNVMVANGEAAKQQQRQFEQRVAYDRAKEQQVQRQQQFQQQQLQAQQRGGHHNVRPTPLQPVAAVGGPPPHFPIPPSPMSPPSPLHIYRPAAIQPVAVSPHALASPTGNPMSPSLAVVSPDASSPSGAPRTEIAHNLDVVQTRKASPSSPQLGASQMQQRGRASSLHLP